MVLLVFNVMISDYYPTHTECGKKQQKINDWERRNLLFVGHIMRYCIDCRKPWLLTISEEEKAALFGVDSGSADTSSPEIPAILNTMQDVNAVMKKSPGRLSSASFRPIASKQ
jgi:hypothetical protein